MWFRMTVVLLMLVAAACQNERRAVWTVFVDENCIKRRLTQIDGQGITVSTYEADGGLTPTAHFETWAEAKKAYPSATESSNCPADVTVTIDDVKSHRPFPAITSDGGSDTGE